MREIEFVAAQGRTATIRVLPDGRCLVRVPSWMSRAHAEKWLSERLPKIESKLARIPLHLICVPRQLELGQAFRVLGEEYLLDNRSSRKLRAFVTDRLDVEVRLVVARHAPLLGLFPHAIHYRAYKSRLGSCRPSRRELTFHWGLGWLPRAHVAAVVAHEMAHLKYGSHGPHFWQTVAMLEPAYEVPHAEARLLGPYLRL